MKYSNCTFISAYTSENYKDKTKTDYHIAFVGVDAFRGEQLIGITASCTKEDYDMVKDLEFGETPLALIYTQNKGYYRVEAVLSVPEPDELDPDSVDPKPKKK